MKKIIIFRTDRLGDFLIITSIIKKLKKKYKDSHITILGSPYNVKLLKKYPILDKIIVYNKKASFFDKIKLILKLNRNNYFASFSFDGKTFSNLVNIIISSKYKFGISYKFQLFKNFHYLYWSKPNFLYNFFIFSSYAYFTSKNNLNKIEHLPTILIKLANNLKLSLKSKDPYYFPVSDKDNLNFKRIYNKYIKEEYILIHIDNKWNDIIDIEINLHEEIIRFQKKTGKILIITSNKNYFAYFKKLKKVSKLNKKIIFFDKLNLSMFERFISNSIYSISCHSGFLVHVAATTNTKLIDIINKNDYLWYSCWRPHNTNHSFVYKSNHKKKFDCKSIFNDILKKIND